MPDEGMEKKRSHGKEVVDAVGCLYRYVHAAAGRHDRRRRHPRHPAGLHASFGQVQWVIDAYALTLASLLLTAGVLADRYGRRLLFAIGLIIFTLGSLLCGLARAH